MIRDAQVVSGWTTTSIASRFLVALLDEAGRPVDDVLAAVGTSRERLLVPDHALPLTAFRELWARAAAVQPDIGITMAERFPPGQMHILAHLALRSATVEAAIADVCRYASVTSAADHLAFECRGALACFSYDCRAPGIENPWMAEHYLSMATLFLARALDRPLPIREVCFIAAAQAPASVYLRRFGVAPRFEADSNALSFDAEALVWPLVTYDAYLHAILENVARTRHAAASDAVLDAAQRAIAASLLTAAVPTIDGVAANCRLSARALRDRLAQRQTTFRKLLDDVRRDLARDHLARGLSVSETAYLLGFSEPAAFQHACKRWFKQSAGDLRRELVGSR